MSSREARTLRRAAERKAAKLARKAAKPANLAVLSPETPLRPSESLTVSTVACPAHDASGTPTTSPATPSPSNGFVSQNRNARAETNRQNAQHSTGPTTAAGKLASSRNSLRHGLASGTLIIPGENTADFEALHNDLLEEHQPATQTEQPLIEQMAQSWWLAQRAIRLQNECFTENGLDDKRLSLLIRYQTTHQRAFHKALADLSRLQKERRRYEIGFVSQPSHFVRQNPPPAGFVSRISANTRPDIGFVLQNDQPKSESPGELLPHAA